jgi:hypothetical protein
MYYAPSDYTGNVNTISSMEKLCYNYRGLKESFVNHRLYNLISFDEENLLLKLKKENVI